MNEEIIVEMTQLTEFFLIVVENNIFHGMIWNFESAKKTILRRNCLLWCSQSFFFGIQTHVPLGVTPTLHSTNHLNCKTPTTDPLPRIIRCFYRFPHHF